MSGPVRTEDTPPDPGPAGRTHTRTDTRTNPRGTSAPAPVPPDGVSDPATAVPASTLEVTTSHTATVGGATVRRALPRRARRTVGPWCFADHMGPTSVAPGGGLEVAPHPHTALHTVTWLTEGEILHRDSLGTEQPIRPGQLNLMTAGRGVSHSEEGTGYGGPLEGIQLWVAQPPATRDGQPAFEHHGSLPQRALDGEHARDGKGAGRATTTVLVGEVGDVVSPARVDWPTVGAEIDVAEGSVVLPLNPAFEHALVVLRGALHLDRTGRDAGAPVIVPGHLAYLGGGRHELTLTAADVSAGSSVALLIGGQPWPEPLVMWWNFVGPDHAAVTEAHLDWEARHERFGQVASALPRTPSPVPPWLDLS
jgi:quercetin 2,3-dioxygenase